MELDAVVLFCKVIVKELRKVLFYSLNDRVYQKRLHFLATSFHKIVPTVLLSPGEATLVFFPMFICLAVCAEGSKKGQEDYCGCAINNHFTYLLTYLLKPYPPADTLIPIQLSISENLNSTLPKVYILFPSTPTIIATIFNSWGQCSNFCN